MKLSVKHGLFIGLIIGIISAFLYAPKSGKQLREELKEKVNSVPKSFFGLLESLVDLIVSVLDFTVQAFEEQSGKLSKAVTSGVNAAKEKANELKKIAANATSGQ